MVEVHISRKARKDLDIFKEYIAQDNLQRAESFSVELLTSSINIISEFPLFCPIYNEPKGIRRYAFKRYNIYYRLSGNGKRANILHILNSALLKNMTLKGL
ncbi:plasmid stabilization system protein [Isorropodon fossajaponicum endosymbiont JTNG4]|uniref:type II toxin-antitoxin system RelE/ParE family toxin n=1 Tax=Isorropodon fossajaponicum symbiont TaxID=883811 RepID=UPI0019158F65|nr:plasmid stabilization system protein [Isorropodon fossajaponicum endosymbiont JTNG4]